LVGCINMIPGIFFVGDKGDLPIRFFQNMSEKITAPHMTQTTA
jgi:hypothetical protein